METLEQSNTSKNVNQTDKENSSEKLIGRRELSGTPFTAINIGEGWFLTLGKYRLTATEMELHELEGMVINKEWPFIMNVMGIMIEEIITEKLNNNK